MSAAGEIADLTRLTRPNIALITRIADSHSAFFASTADIAAAKAEIFQAIEGLSIAILNRDDAFYATCTPPRLRWCQTGDQLWPSPRSRLSAGFD